MPAPITEMPKRPARSAKSAPVAGDVAEVLIFGLSIVGIVATFGSSIATSTFTGPLFHVSTPFCVRNSIDIVPSLLVLIIKSTPSIRPSFSILVFQSQIVPLPL